MSKYVGGSLTLLTNRRVKVTLFDLDPWVDPKNPKMHQVSHFGVSDPQILPRNWKLLTGPTDVVLDSEYVAVHSESEELLNVHVDVIPKPIGEVRQNRLQKRWP